MKKYNKEFLISEFWRFYDENGRYPLGKDLSKTEGYPNQSSYDRKWGSWTNFLNELGLLGSNGWYKCDEQILRELFSAENKEIIADSLIVKRTWGQIKKKANSMGLFIKENIYKNKDKQFFIDEVKRYYKIYNKIPTMKDINEDKEFPGRHQFSKFFNSWDDVLKSSGFETKVNMDEYKEEIIGDYVSGIPLKEIAEKYEREQGTILNFIDKYNVKRRNKKWSKEQLKLLEENYPIEEWDILLELLSPFSKLDIESKASDLKIPRECYFGNYNEDEINWFIENYSTCTKQDIFNRFPNRTLIAIRTKASRLGLKTREFWSEEDLDELKELYPYERDNQKLAKIFNRSNVSIVNTANNIGVKKEFPKSDTEEIKKQKRIQMIKDLQEFAEVLGRTPFISEINANKNIASEISYRRFFGAYSEACVQAGLTPNYTIFGEHKPVLLSKNNDICLSKNELYLTNIFIDNNINYEKEEMYRNIIDDSRCGLKRSDWFINGIIVEYFGLMDKDYYKKKTVEKIQICKDNNIELIELYPDDIKNNFKGVKDKFNIHNINLCIEYKNILDIVSNY